MRKLQPDFACVFCGDMITQMSFLPPSPSRGVGRNLGEQPAARGDQPVDDSGKLEVQRGGRQVRTFLKRPYHVRLGRP